MFPQLLRHQSHEYKMPDCVQARVDQVLILGTNSSHFFLGSLCRRYAIPYYRGNNGSLDPIAHMSHEKNPGCLGYIGDSTTQILHEIIINHYMDPS